MRYVIYPYKMGSSPSRMLREGLEDRGHRTLRVFPNRNYRPRHDDVVINWGNSEVPQWFNGGYGRFLNHPDNIALASNKLKTFRALEAAGVAIPRFTTNRNEAQDFDRVAVRHTLQGHSGQGLEICEAGDDIPNAPLYTEMIDNYGEYRVHVFNGEVMDYAKKRRHRDDEATGDEVDIKTWENGWIFTRGHLRRLERIENLAKEAISALGLDFGAVDIIKDENRRVFVLEVNTACGMADTTLNNYLDAICRL